MFRKTTSVFVVLILLMGMIITPAAFAETQEGFQYSRELFEEIRQRIEQNHVEPPNENDIYEGAIRGYIEGLDDPHTEYFPPEEYKKFTERLDRKFQGVGISINKVEDYIVIISPIEGTPGDKEGLKSGDKIIAVDGQNIIGRSTEYAVSIIRGEEGTDVNLTILRDQQELEFIITREVIDLPSIDYENYGPIGHIRILNFTEDTGREFKRALDQMVADGIEGIVVDVRSNPGGHLTSAFQVSSNFVQGPLLNIVQRDGRQISYGVPRGFRQVHIPMKVLVNQGSASASEIFAMGMQYHDRAQVIGVQTFGKGSVQSLANLSNGGVLKYTSSYYFSPDGEGIDGTGITPDIIIEEPGEQKETALNLLRKIIGREIIFKIDEEVAKWVDVELETGIKPQVRKDEFLLPLELIMDHFEDGKEYNETRRGRVIFTWDNRDYIFNIDEDKVTINEDEYELNQGLRKINGKVMVPVSVIRGYIGIGVIIDEDEGEITLKY